MLNINSRKQKKSTIDDDETPFELTTELLVVRALERGFSLKDFEGMTIGFLIGCIVTYNNVNFENDENKEDEIVEAGQEEFDQW